MEIHGWTAVCELHFTDHELAKRSVKWFKTITMVQKHLNIYKPTEMFIQFYAIKKTVEDKFAAHVMINISFQVTKHTMNNV